MDKTEEENVKENVMQKIVISQHQLKTEKCLTINYKTQKKKRKERKLTSA